MRRLAGFLSAAALVACVGCSQSDAGITTAVKSKLAADDTVKAYQVNVNTDHHVVTLKGDVNTTAAKDRAVQIARGTNGVRDVIDQLTVTEAAATTGLLDDKGNTTVVSTDEVKVKAKKGGDKTVAGSKKIGNKIKGAFTDKNKDSDHDGK